MDSEEEGGFEEEEEEVEETFDPALLNAIRSGDTEEAVRLIDGGADVSQGDEGGHTPLMAAAELDDRTLVRMLLDARASATASDLSYQSTALHLACNALFEKVETDKFAAKDRAFHGEEEEETEVNGFDEVAAMLLQAGADPNAIDKSENTPLHLAVEAGGDPPLMLDLWSRPSPAGPSSSLLLSSLELSDAQVYEP